MLPIIFQPFATAGFQDQDVRRTALQSIAADPSHCSSRWLGHFTLDQMDHLKRFFEPYGRVPCDELTNPLWNELLSCVEEVWLALNFRFILPDEERLPLTYQLVDRAEMLSGDRGNSAAYSDPSQSELQLWTAPVLVL